MQPPPSPRFTRSQRWRDRRQQFVPSATEIDPSEFSVDVAPRTAAHAFVQAHHYTGSKVASRFNAGLYRNGKGGRPQLVGVASFSVPMSSASIPLHTAMEAHQGVDLGRLVLDHEVAGNGETWFLSRAFRLLRSGLPEIQAVTAYADPLIRRDAAGNPYVPGHCGGAYSALNPATYRGRATPRTLLLLPDGRTFSGRAISKIRNLETGHAYAVDQLVAAGATAPRLGQDLRAWYDALAAGPFFRRLRHPGAHVFSFPLTLKARLAARRLPQLKPPRRDPDILDGDVTALPLFDQAA